MWEFTDIRDRAIRELSEHNDAVGPIDKIERGKSYDVNTWELEGYVELLKRTETITNEEAERLGWKTAAKLLLLREQYLNSQWPTGNNGLACSRCGSSSCRGQYYRTCNSYGGYHLCGQQFTSRDQYDFTAAVKKEFEFEFETETAGNKI